MKIVQRSFIPGSKWAYFKIYTGTKTADKILIHKIPFIVKELYNNNKIDKWFFIRYADPDFHLRIRFLLKDDTYWGDSINLFYNHLGSSVRNNLIWKIQLDTYNRELERYGNNLIEEAETLFCIDSKCTISLLKKLDEKDENYRWMIGLYLINQFLSDFSIDITTKQQWMEHWSMAFKTEFGFDMYNSKQFNSKYREHKSTIEQTLKNKIGSADFNALQLPIKKRSKELRPVVSQIQTKLKNQKVKKTSLESLLSNYIHMMMNRLFHSKNRQHEMVLYDFMNRYYKSELAKSKLMPVIK